MARTETSLAPDGGLPLLAGPLHGRLVRCLHTLQAAGDRVPAASPGTRATLRDLAWTLVSAWSVQAARTRAADLAHLVGLTEVAGALRDQVDRDARSVEQLRSEVAARLAADPDAQGRTRAVLAEHWEVLPPGSAEAGELEHLLTTLFGGPKGRAAAAAVDVQIDGLPGLAGLGLMAGVLDRRSCADRWVADVLDLRAVDRQPSPSLA